MSGISPTDIIREVKCRPALYNINLKEYKQTGHKQKLWLQVAEVLTPAEDWEEFSDEDKKARIDLIHTKWKNLRDHFHRVLKLREEEGDTQRPKYKHFDDMEFMRPFVGFKPPLNRKVTKLESVEIINEPIGNVTDFDMEALLNTNDDEEEEIEPPNKRPKRIIKPTPKAAQKQISSPLSNKIAKEPVIRKFDGLRKTTVSTEGAFPCQSPSFKVRDGDISFCLSIVPNLRKLGDSKKLRAKIDILKVLQKYNDEYEKSRFLRRSVTSKKQNNNSTRDVEKMEDTDIPEDHLEDLDSADNVVNVKNEHYIDPLNDNGNTKTWWT